MTRPTTARALAPASLMVAAVLALSSCSTDPGGEAATVPPATTPEASVPPTEMSTPTPTPTQAAASDSPPGPVTPTGDPAVIATNLDLPWSMVRLDSGVTLVSERDTALVKEISDTGAVREVGTVPGVVPGGEGGLLGLAVNPADPAWLYAYTTSQNDNRVVRMPLTATAGAVALGSPEVIFDGIPKAGNHNGGRIKFGPDGALYIATGDAGVTGNSQDLASLGGKILRVDATGAIPADNPFPGSPVYSYGHRNPQGIAWDRDGRLWASEFGQNTWDELNLIEPGVNYGWPAVEGIGDNPDFRNPVYQWSTSEASPSGLHWSRDTLFMAALRGERLWTITATPESVGVEDWFAGQFGRLRDVIDGPNGTLWILTNNTGRTPRDEDDKILEVRLAALEEG